MASIDVRFSGSVPANYEQYLVPLLFRPYAELLAQRTSAFAPKRILETAAGTGVVTDALPRAAGSRNRRDRPQPGDARRCRERVDSSPCLVPAADALDLPFDEDEFDLVVCQFGAMFYPDKVKGNAEARRVLRDGGHYLLAIWDAIERNPMSDLAHQTMVEQFPDNPPMFMKRGPFSYHDPEWIERDLTAAGFDKIGIDTVKLPQPRDLLRRSRARALLRFTDAHRARRIWRKRARRRFLHALKIGEKVRWAKRVRSADVGAYRHRD